MPVARAATLDPTAPATPLFDLPYMPVEKRALPAGRPREWYVAHNRRLKAMRLAIVLLDAGVWRPEQASDRTIRRAAERVGIHEPSPVTCHMVRALMRYSR
ncbi:hypothetical protein ACQYWQ_06950 [Streptomyces sp. P6-2-1]|uniref:hypothetical protein n=1 Tax=Streptomyces sp. P6-2-1 TaxID=3422591 RepID=UPI003D36F842